MSYFKSFGELPTRQLFPGIEARIAHSDKVTLTQVTLEEGATLPEHHHFNEQWSTVLSGELEMEIDGEKKVVTPGMTVYIPSNMPHKATALTHCLVLDLFVPVREDFK